MTVQSEYPRASYATMRVIWIAFLISVCLYFFLAYLITKERISPPSENLELFIAAMVILSVVDIAMAFVIWKRIPRWVIRRLIDKAKNDGASSDPKQRRRIGLVAAQALMVMTYAFCESCAIYGMVLVIMGAELIMLIPFAAATFISLLIFRPDADFIDRVTRKLDVYADIGV